jgi:hypothetical protein
MVVKEIDTVSEILCLKKTQRRWTKTKKIVMFIVMYLVYYCHISGKSERKRHFLYERK